MLRVSARALAKRPVKARKSPAGWLAIGRPIEAGSNRTPPHEVTPISSAAENFRGQYCTRLSHPFALFAVLVALDPPMRSVVAGSVENEPVPFMTLPATHAVHGGGP